jgi:predicted ATPase
LDGSAAVFFATGIGNAYLCENQRQKNLHSAFLPTEVPSPANFVACPAVLEMAQKRLTAGTQHEVIVGNHGTGKPTMVSKVAGTTPGVIYVYATGGNNISTTLNTASQNALNWEDHQPSWLDEFLQNAAQF